MKTDVIKELKNSMTVRLKTKQHAFSSCGFGDSGDEMELVFTAQVATLVGPEKQLGVIMHECDSDEYSSPPRPMPVLEDSDSDEEEEEDTFDDIVTGGPLPTTLPQVDTPVASANTACSTVVGDIISPPTALAATIPGAVKFRMDTGASKNFSKTDTRLKGERATTQCVAIADGAVKPCLSFGLLDASLTGTDSNGEAVEFDAGIPCYKAEFSDNLLSGDYLVKKR